MVAGDEAQRPRPRHRYPKRLLDIAVSAAALLVLAPLIAVVALAVRARLGTPVLFRQSRPGLHGVPFTLVKFRSMIDAVEKDGRLLTDAERMTGFGRFLRSTSLDELPELWNVLKGDMSLVGPRPLLLQYLPLYSPDQMRRHEVRPGLTGWAQVNGRNAVDWPQRFALDVWYVDNVSFLLDLKILFLTLLQVVRRRGISAEGEATMPYFQGNGEGTAAADGGGEVPARRRFDNEERQP
jgi:lipopolysaccharide/colanic/teichoic acid biosynthesis glycosyltransferase